jgi:hypothetical protein
MLRLPFLAGVQRYVRRTQPARARWFEPAFKFGVAARAAWEVARAPFYWALRRLRGRPERAARTLATARARLRFLERDLGRFLRARGDAPAPGAPASTSRRPGPASSRGRREADRPTRR